MSESAVTAVIIDDQEDAIEDLEYLIKKNKLPLEIVGRATSGAEGMAAILKHKPQLVFLDVVMPGMSGFEMLDLLPGIDFQLVITTSMNQYAIQAIRASALDFLLKPLKEQELKDAVDRARNKKLSPDKSQLHLLHDNMLGKDQKVKKIALPLSNGVDLVLLEDILYFESEGNYTTVHFRNNTSVVVTRQIGKFDEVVANSGFFRVHNSFLVNLNCIKKVIKSDGGYLILENNKSINIARNRKEPLFEALNLYL